MYQDVKRIPILDYSVNSYDSKDKSKKNETGKTPEPEPASSSMGYRKNQEKCYDPSEKTPVETQHT